jgi:hypothetical protein
LNVVLQQDQCVRFPIRLEPAELDEERRLVADVEAAPDSDAELKDELNESKRMGGRSPVQSGFRLTQREPMAQLPELERVWLTVI